jgi:uncharacterized membrane protein
MGTVAQAKTLGGIGSIFTLLFIVPTVGWLLAFVGFILMLVAVKYIADSLGDQAIFNNMIISVIAAIAGVVIGGVFILGSALTFVMPSMGAGVPTYTAGNMIGFLLGVIVGLVVVWIAYIASAYFLRKSYNVIADRLGVGMFRTAALLYLIGAITVVILVGFAIIFVAEILQVVAFFSLPEAPPVGPAFTQPSPSTQPSIV